MSAADRRHGGATDDYVSRAVTLESACAIWRAVGIGDREMDVFEFQRCIRGDANRAVQVERHIPQRDFALNKQLSVVAKWTGTNHDHAVMQGRQRCFGERQRGHRDQNQKEQRSQTHIEPRDEDIRGESNADID